MKLYNKGKLVSTHFKRKRHESTKGNIMSKIIIIFMVLILTYFISDIVKGDEKEEYNYEDIVAQVKQKAVEVQRLQAEADITKAILEVSASKAERFVTQIKNEIEYLTLTENGSYSVENSRTSDKAGWWKRTFSESKITVNFDYAAIFSICTSDINFYISDGVINIEYDPNIIDVKSIEISNITTDYKKDWFGKKYTNQELVSIIEISKEKIYEQLNNDSSLKIKSCDNLNNYFKSIGNKLKVDDLVINNAKVIEKKYNFINNGTIKFNHSFKPLENVEYLVIHSTACTDVSALQFYNNLNSSVQKRECSAHFYIDDKNVVQTISTNLEAWHCYSKNPLINCTNRNSIGVEITEFSDPEKQQKAIDNTVDFVKNVLQKEFPNAKIVCHREIKATQCPHILTDEEFNKLFRD